MTTRTAPGVPMHVRLVPQPDDVAGHLGPQDVLQVAETFPTPLTGTCAWNYEEADERIQKLYRLGNERNWNADFDIDWNRTFPRSRSPKIDGIQNRFDHRRGRPNVAEADVDTSFGEVS